MRIKNSYARLSEVQLWPEHVEAWELFTACATQWSVIAGMGGAIYQGIDNARLSSTRVEMELPPSRDRMEKIRRMEAGALSILNQRK